MFTCLGPYGIGAGVEATTTYTFVTSIDNTQMAKRSIGATPAARLQRQKIVSPLSTRPHLVRRATGDRGPRRHVLAADMGGPQTNAYVLSGTQIKVHQQAECSRSFVVLSRTSSAFAWSGAQTAGKLPAGSAGTKPAGHDLDSGIQEGYEHGCTGRCVHAGLCRYHVGCRHSTPG